MNNRLMLDNWQNKLDFHKNTRRGLLQRFFLPYLVTGAPLDWRVNDGIGGAAAVDICDKKL